MNKFQEDLDLNVIKVIDRKEMILLCKLTNSSSQARLVPWIGQSEVTNQPIQTNYCNIEFLEHGRWVVKTQPKDGVRPLVELGPGMSITFKAITGINNPPSGKYKITLTRNIRPAHFLIDN